MNHTVKAMLSSILLISSLAFGPGCDMLTGKDKDKDKDKDTVIALIAAFAVSGADGNACTSGSQCVSGTCINSTCGGVIASGGTIPTSSACTTPGTFTPNQCVNSTCGTTSICGGKGAACQTSSNCATPQTGTYAGCGNLVGSSRLCGGFGAACATNGSCVSNLCNGGFCT
ncbi:MAG: hypothetical protein K8S54_08405 [Spirochaetia bacterium]|nr:hypothetical protein [Spirochaetia bacterium]